MNKGKEVFILKKVLKSVANAIYSYSVWGAGAASLHGTFEVKVPASIQKK